MLLLVTPIGPPGSIKIVEIYAIFNGFILCCAQEGLLMSHMDLHSNEIAWVGNIYRRFEAVCQEINDIRIQVCMIFFFVFTVISDNNMTGA